MSVYQYRFKSWTKDKAVVLDGGEETNCLETGTLIYLDELSTTKD